VVSSKQFVTYAAKTHGSNEAKKQKFEYSETTVGFCVRFRVSGGYHQILETTLFFLRDPPSLGLRHMSDTNPMHWSSSDVLIVCVGDDDGSASAGTHFFEIASDVVILGSLGRNADRAFFEASLITRPVRARPVPARKRWHQEGT
jgi:hypothetical protein